MFARIMLLLRLYRAFTYINKKDTKSNRKSSPSFGQKYAERKFSYTVLKV